MNRAALTAATTVAPTTTTTAPVVTTTPAAIRPPTAILSAASGQVAGVLGSWCWPQLNGETLCLSLSRNGPPDPPASLPVTQGETVTLRFETAVPLVDLQVGLWTGGPPRPAIAAPVATRRGSRSALRLAARDRRGRHLPSHATEQGGVRVRGGGPDRRSAHCPDRLIGPCRPVYVSGVRLRSWWDLKTMAGSGRRTAQARRRVASSWITHLEGSKLNRLQPWKAHVGWAWWFEW